MTVKDIMGLIPTMQSVKLVDETMKHSKKKGSVSNNLHSATKILVGTSLIQAESQLIGGL